VPMWPGAVTDQVRDPAERGEPGEQARP